MYSKITTGYVIQTFYDDGTPYSQDFIAGDEVEYEDDEGNPMDAPDNEQYLPYHMVQPEDMKEAD